MEQNTEIRIGKTTKIKERKKEEEAENTVWFIKELDVLIGVCVMFGRGLIIHPYYIHKFKYVCSVCQLCACAPIFFLVLFFIYFWLRRHRKRNRVAVWPRPGHRMRYKTKLFSRCTYFRTKYTVVANFSPF